MNMARRRKIPIAATAGMFFGLRNLYDAYRGGGTNAAVESLSGYNPVTGTFNWKKATAVMPMAVGAGVSMVASKVGLNRYIRVPMVSI